MRWIVWVLLAFATAVGLALLIRFNHGNVAILWPPYRVEVSANLALALLTVAFVVLHVLVNGTSRALALPGRIRDYQARRRERKSTAALRDSVLAFFEGRLGRVERLARAAQASPATAGAAALLAARSAQRLQEPERRDRWLTEAAQAPEVEHALQMTQAELAVEEQRNEEAIDLIRKLNPGGAPRQLDALRTALRAYEQAERWDDVLQTLRLAEKREALEPAAIRRLRTSAFDALLARKAGDLPAIRELWRALRPEDRTLPELAAGAARALIDGGSPEEARRILEHALDAGYGDRLVVVYSRLGTVALRDRLARLEGWRERYGNEPGLLLTLGGICAAEKLWGKAEDYLTLALRLQPSVAAHVALGELYEAIERPADAAAQFRMGARLAID